MFGARARARSTELSTPWYEAPALDLSLAYPVGAVAALLYASLLPFRFNRAALTDFDILALWEAGLRATNAADIVTNILVYMPVGALLFFSRWGRALLPIQRFTITILIGAAVSIVAETFQSVILERVTSCTDTTLNVFGTFLGAGMAVSLRTFAHRRTGALADWGRRPLHAALIILTVGLVGHELAPFDFITSTSALHASFLNAHWDVVTPRPIGLDVAPLIPLTHQLAGAAWFAVLAALTVIARTDGRDPGDAFASAFKHGVMLAGLIEMLQLFTHSHTFDIGTIVLRSLAVAFGAWVGLFIRNIGYEEGIERHKRFRATSSLLVTLVMFQLILMLANVWFTGANKLFNVEIASIAELPFEALWRSTLAVAVADVLSDAVVYGTLACTLAASILHLSGGISPDTRSVGDGEIESTRVLIPTVVLVAIAAVGIEFLRSAMKGVIDLTPVIIAIVSGHVAIRMTIRVIQFYSLDLTASATERQVHSTLAKANSVSSPIGVPLTDGPG